MDTVLKICYDCNEEKLHYVDKGHVAAYCNGCQVLENGFGGMQIVNMLG